MQEPRRDTLEQQVSELQLEITTVEVDVALAESKITTIEFEQQLRPWPPPAAQQVLLTLFVSFLVGALAAGAVLKAALVDAGLADPDDLTTFLFSVIPAERPGLYVLSVAVVCFGIAGCALAWLTRISRQRQKQVDSLTAARLELAKHRVHRNGLQEQCDKLQRELDKLNELEAARNYETARRFEDAARLYEKHGLYHEAGRARRAASVSVRKVLNITVDLNSLLAQLRASGQTVSHNCTNCGAQLKITGKSSAQRVVVCEYCDTALDVQTVASVIQDALGS